MPKTAPTASVQLVSSEWAPSFLRVERKLWWRVKFKPLRPEFHWVTASWHDVLCSSSPGSQELEHTRHLRSPPSALTDSAQGGVREGRGSRASKFQEERR